MNIILAILEQNPNGKQYYVIWYIQAPVYSP